MARRCAGADATLSSSAAVEPIERRVLVDRSPARPRAGRRPAPLDHVPFGAGQRLARQHAMDAGEDRLGAGGELQLQQLLARGADARRARPSPASRSALRLGREGEAAVDRRRIERLDAERIARQRDGAGRALVDRDRIHAAQVVGEATTVAQPEMQRRLAIAVRSRNATSGSLGAEFAVIVDLAVRDQRGAGRRTAAGPRPATSMIASRVCTSAIRPTTVCPAPSGPRCAERARQRAEHARDRAARRPRPVTRPAMPHIRASPLRRGKRRQAPRPAPPRTPARTVARPASASSCRALGIVQDGADRFRERARVLVRNEQPIHAGPDQLARPVGVGGDDGPAGGPRLDHDVAKRLVPRGADEQVRGRQQRAGVASPADQVQPVRYAFTPRQSRRSVASPRPRPRSPHARPAAAARRATRTSNALFRCSRPSASSNARRRGTPRCLRSRRARPPGRRRSSAGGAPAPPASPGPDPVHDAARIADQMVAALVVGRGRNTRRAARTAPNRPAGAKRAARFIQATTTRGAKRRSSGRSRGPSASPPGRRTELGGRRPASAAGARGRVAPDDWQDGIACPMQGDGQPLEEQLRPPAGAPAITWASLHAAAGGRRRREASRVRACPSSRAV